MPQPLSRREILAAAGAAVAAMALPAFAEPVAPSASRFHISLNTSTIRGQARPLPEEVDIAAQCGYDAIEPWLGEIEKYAQGGGALPDLRKRISDAGLTVESSIAFFAWVVDDDAKRVAALEVAKRQMDLVAQIGGKRIAAPPVGATDVTNMDRHKIAERYAALIDLGQSSGIVPELELWGHSKTLGRLDEAIEVERAANRPQACLLLDIYHLYKGNSDLSALRTLKPTELHVIHVNDYPADPPREKINDSFRVYPGDGVAPLGDIFRTLRDIGFNGYLSVELFNRDYWKQNPLKTAQIAIEKTKAAIAKALG